MTEIERQEFVGTKDALEETATWLNEERLKTNRLQKRITELEDLNTELTDTYNKHMQSWADKYNLLEAENVIMVKAIDNYAALPHHLAGPARDVIDSIHKLRAEGGGD